MNEITNPISEKTPKTTGTRGLSSDRDRLSPWPVRLMVYVVLVLAACLAILVIDGHVMKRMYPVMGAPSSDRP